jgi:light-harvesting complex I chlorophyll a/b binding protein 2
LEQLVSSFLRPLQRLEFSIPHHGSLQERLHTSQILQHCFVVEIILFAWAEGRRWADILKPGSENTDPIFPNNKLTGTDVGYPVGLWFDPLRWGSASPEKVKDLRTREIKNGRLAMLAVLGAAFQVMYTGTGPIDNLLAHLADPGHNTIFAVSQLSSLSLVTNFFYCTIMLM